MDSAFDKPQVKESSILGDSRKGSTEVSDKGELLCSEGPQGATGWDPGSVSLTEKVGTLSLQRCKRNQCAAAKRQACRARCVEAPTGNPLVARLDSLKVISRTVNRNQVHPESS
jgi:hypothetical protein